MLLKLFLALVPMLFFSDAAGGTAGDGTDGDDDNGDDTKGDSTSGSSGDDAGGDDQKGGDNDGGDDKQPSANKLIKDFAAERGISVSELLTEFDKIEKSSKTDLQRIEGERDKYKTERDTAITELRELRAKDAVTSAAKDSGALDPDAIFSLVSGRITYGKDGKPTNVEDVITKAKEAHPKLFGEGLGGSDAGEGGGGGDPISTINDNIRRAARRGQTRG